MYLSVVHVMHGCVVVRPWHGSHALFHCQALVLYPRSTLLLFGWFSVSLSVWPRSGELRTQKFKSHLVRTQSLNILSLKPGVGQYIAIPATFTSRDFFLAYLYPSGPFSCIFFQNLSRFLLYWLWLTHGSCVFLQNKIGHPARCRFPCWVPAKYK